MPAHSAKKKFVKKQKGKNIIVIFEVINFLPILFLIEAHNARAISVIKSNDLLVETTVAITKKNTRII